MVFGFAPSFDVFIDLLFVANIYVICSNCFLSVRSFGFFVELRKSTDSLSALTAYDVAIAFAVVIPHAGFF